MPNACEGVPAELLHPRNTWADKEAYDKQCEKLAHLFNDNFKKFEDGASEEIKHAAPKVSAVG
jgi:phosphoenolpyruvate carboxykinase (ATP)